MSGKELHDQCWTLIRQRKFDDAISLSRRLCTQYPDSSLSWYTLSIAARSGRLSAVALAAIDKSLEIDPNALDYLAHKCLCLLSVARPLEAIALARKTMALSPTSKTVLLTIAHVFAATDEFEDLLITTEKLLRVAPNDIDALESRAQALRNVGKLKEAEDLYSKVIKLAPKSYSAYWNRSQVRKASKTNNAVSAMKALLTETTLPWRAEMQISYALAKECEDMEQYDESFEYCSRGAHLRRTNSNYDVEGDIVTMKKIMQVYNKALPAPKHGGGKKSSTPIFVLGLPRSGTTLVERILAAHPDVKSAGELQSFPTTLVKSIQSNTNGQTLDKLQTVEKSLDVNWSELGSAYLADVGCRGGKTAFFVDKLPTNYLYIGLIAQALPNARIVLLMRDPMDSCYAMYKTLFGEAYPFTYSQEDLGRYYIAWHSLMQHWKKVCGDRVFVMKYEDLVSDTEASIKTLLKHCRLDWNENCLNFHTQSGGVSTASAAQVRQPIYSSSIGKWKFFREHLEPLEKTLYDTGLEIE